jgi:methionyl-tRNA synthetase
MTEKIAVFTAWPYVNGNLHIGHLAGAYVPADIFVRYQRLRGRDVAMMSGSDTHGTPITVRAEKEGVSPRAIVDRYHNLDLQAYQRMGISYDLYTETDTENHWHVAQQMFLRLQERGYIYKEVMKAFYCESCRRFLADRYVEGTCPHCHYEEARGDQCDNCGHTLDAIELIKPRCKTCGAMPVIRDTEHFFLDLGKLNPPLLAWLEEDKAHWRPNVINFSLAQARGGELHGRPITRDIEWGINVPAAGFEHKRLYVWFEAVIGYLSVTFELAQRQGRPEAWAEWWTPDVRAYQFIGKDNIPFHTIIWPAILLGHGDLVLPYDVPANEYLMVSGKQLSKSRNWVIDVLDYLERYEPDPLRYMLAINDPERSDSNFTWDEFVRRNNDELVATWGNLVNRVLTFTYKRFEGRVPQPAALDARDQALLAQIRDSFEPIGQMIEECKFKAAITEIMALAQQANRYLNEKEPWTRIKTDPAAAATSLYVCLQAITWLRTMLTPFLPFTCQRLHEMLGFAGSLIGRIEIEERAEATRSHNTLRFDASELTGKWEPETLPAGQPLREPKPLFLKLDDSIAETEMERMNGRV